MRHERFAVALLASVLLFAVLGNTGCGQSGGQVGPPPPPAKTVTSVAASANPTTLQLVASGSQPTSTITATVRYSDGTSDSAATLSASPSGAGTISGTTFTPNVVTSAETVTITATATADASKTGNTQITVNPAPVAPTIALDRSSATVAFGKSTTFTITATGTPAPTVSCGTAQPSSVASCSVSGTTATYTVANPAAAPASFTDTLTLTAQNSAGQASAQAAITLIASMGQPSVRNSSDPAMPFCIRYNCTIIVDITGTGFWSGASEWFQDLTDCSKVCNAAVSVTDSSHAVLTVLVSKTDYEPKAFHVGVQDKAGSFDPSVGATANLYFRGNQNMLATSDTEAFLLEQATGIVHKFKLSDGSADGSFSVGLAFGIAYDSATKNLITSNVSGAFGVWDANGTLQPIGGSDGNKPLAVSASGGYMLASEPEAGQVVSLQLLLNNSTLVPLAIGNTPTSTGMLTLSGSNQLVGAVYNAGDVNFKVVPVPIPSQNPAPLWTLAISGFTPLNQITSPPNGGWPLAVFQAKQKAAILSWFDKKAAIIDLASKTQTQTVDLTNSGHLLQMAADDVHGKAIVATANLADETSSFLAIDLATGTVSTLQSTSPFYCGAIGVSTDGTKIYCGLGSQFKIITNQ